MPYIKKEGRERIEPQVNVLSTNLYTKGDMNYAITKLLHNYIEKMGLRYDTLNDAIGIIECVKQELYRRVIADYENLKIKENGDIEFEIEIRKKKK